MTDRGSRPDEPLTAPIGAQLRAKEELAREAEADRAADARTHARIERGKAEERGVVARAMGAAGSDELPRTWRERRAAARARGRAWAASWDAGGRALGATGAALALLGLALRRRALVLGGLPLLAGALLVRRRLPG